MGKTIKFGGTSLGDSDLDKNAVKYAISQHTNGETTVVVVSGQGKSKKREGKEKLTDYAYKILSGDITSKRECNNGLLPLRFRCLSQRLPLRQQRC